MFTIRIDMRGADVLRGRMGVIEARFLDLRPFWRDVTREFFEVERRQFASEGASGASGRWARLRPSTVEEKRRSGYGSRGILRRTGGLERALTRAGSPEQSVEERPDALEIEVAGLARLHQRGTSRMPAREVVAPTDAQKRQMLRPLARGLVEFVKRQGFGVSE